MRNLWIALAVSITVNLLCMYVHYQTYQETHYLKWASRNHCGESTIEFAPGWEAVHTYAMLPEDRDLHRLSFAPASLAFSVMTLMLAGCAVLAKLSTGEPLKDFLLLFLGCIAILFSYWAVTELWDEFL